jgi:hypothetical protein
MPGRSLPPPSTDSAASTSRCHGCCHGCNGGFEFRLLQWRWQLTDIMLPENIQNALADELIKARKAPERRRDGPNAAPSLGRVRFSNRPSGSSAFRLFAAVPFALGVGLYDGSCWAGNRPPGAGSGFGPVTMTAGTTQQA